MRELAELILTVVLGVFFFLFEEFYHSAKFALLALLLPLFITVPLTWILVRRPKSMAAWCTVGALQAALTAVLRLGVVYGAYVSYLRGFHCFDRLDLDNVTYLMFGLSGAVAGGVVARRGPKRWLRIFPLIGISLGVLYHYNLADTFWSSFLSFPVQATILFGAEFVAPTLYAWLALYFVEWLRRRALWAYMEGLQGR